MKNNINYLFYIMLLLILTINLYGQDNIDTNKNKFNLFRQYQTDKYYMGWQDYRSFITRVFFNKNFTLENTLNTISKSDEWNFNDKAVTIDAKIATEFAFYRNEYFSVGAAGAMKILTMCTPINDGIKCDVYDFNGQIAVYIDIWFDKIFEVPNTKIRIYPMYHQSTHYVDGYKGEFENGSGYEFASIAIYHFKDFGKAGNMTIYGGLEGTYHTIGGNGSQLFRGFLGLDYRKPISKKHDINFITGINLSMIYDDKDNLNLIEEQWHPALNIAFGFEFYRYTLSLKYVYQRGRGATTYFKNQHILGFEMGVLF